MLKKIEGKSAEILLSFARRNGVVPKNSDLKALDVIKFKHSPDFEEYVERMFTKSVDKNTVLKLNDKIKRSNNPVVDKVYKDTFQEYIDKSFEKHSNEITGNVCSIPFIDEGVLEVENKIQPYKIYFQTTDYDKETGKGTLFLAMYERQHTNYVWQSTFKLENFNFFINPIEALKQAEGKHTPITMGLLAYGVIEGSMGNDIPNDNKSYIIRDLNGYQAYPKYADKELIEVTQYITDALCVFGYINQQLEQYKDIEQVDTKQDAPAKINRNKKVIYECEGTVDKRKYLLIGKDITVAVGDNSHLQTSTVNQKKTIHRLVDVWSVRGHIRHYKSGKEVYIQPYQKGRNRATGKPQPKTYIIADKNNDEINI